MNHSQVTASPRRPVSGATSATADESPAHDRLGEPTLASTWQAVAGSPVGDELLEWPPDVFALTDVILERAEAFRFVLSPPDGVLWPPGGDAGWSDAVGQAARRWSAWAEDRDGAVPELVAEKWGVVRERAGIPLEQVADGLDWRVGEALLTLHAIADEACAGLFVALDRSDGEGCVYRARGRERLARAGSLARMHSHFLRVLPKIRTPPTGRASFSRYACVHRPGLETRWHKLPARHRGTDPQAEHAQLLLLPWPLRVRESDFRAVEGSVQRLAKEPFGFFEFAPEERLDLDLVDRMLLAARDEVGRVDVVLLPESAVEESELDPLEALLNRHGVVYLQAGVRKRSRRPGELGSNQMHIGVNPRLEKGGPFPSSPCGQWFHIRQDKHHRWSLDDSQIYQYHLGGALHPHIRWWEAIDVPRRSVQVVELGEGITIVSLVCEDLAQNDDLAEVIRSIGPTIVSTALLDGPQLASRWSARYASVLADDPGSAVMTLTSFGMAQRSRPPGRDSSPVIALWKDPARGIREISLEPGAQGVLLTVCGARATRRSADGRWPVESGTHDFDVAVHQIRASEARSESPSSRSGSPTPPVIDVDDLTVLTGWAEALAEALAYTPERARAVLADARPGALWRADLGIADPSPRLSDAIDSIERALGAATPAAGAPTLDALLFAVRDGQPSESAFDRLARGVLRSTLEQLCTRQAQHRILAALEAPTAERFSTITARTVLLGGAKSPGFISRQPLADLGQVIPESTALLLPGLGHNAPEEQPREIATAILATATRSPDKTVETG
jgi:hypothetical protein